MVAETSRPAPAPAAAAPLAWRMRGIAARWSPVILLLILVAAIVVTASGFGSPFVQRRVTLGLVDLAAVVGLYIFVGNSGLLSFGHVGFMAVGAYASALLTMRPAAKAMFLPGLPAFIAHASLSPVAAIAIGAGCASVFALAVGLVLMRLSGMAASIATFALLIIVNVVLGNWDSVTGGQRSLMGIPATVGIWTAFFGAAVAMIIAFAYQETGFALSLRAAREDEVAAIATGVHVYWQRLGAFVLSAFVSGMAGGLMAHLLGTLRVDTFYLDLTFIAIAMLVVGGTRSLTGAVVGTIVVVAISETMRFVEAGISVPGTGLTLAAPAGLGDVLVALMLLLMIVLRPKGISNGRELMWRAPGKARPDGA